MTGRLTGFTEIHNNTKQSVQGGTIVSDMPNNQLNKPQDFKGGQHKAPEDPGRIPPRPRQRGTGGDLLRRGATEPSSLTPFPARGGGGGRTGTPPLSRDWDAKDRVRGSDHRVAQTNPPVRGRVSADRSEEAAQPLTTPLAGT